MTPERRFKRRRQDFTPSKSIRSTKALSKAEVKRIAKGVITNTAEWKHHSATTTGTVSTSFGIVDVSAVPQGDSDLSRDGDQLTLQNMQMIHNWSNGDDNNRVRLVVFQWFPNTVPVVGDILDTTIGFVPDYPIKSDARDSFKILFDTTTTLNAAYTGGTVFSPTRKTTLRNMKKKMQFANATTIGSNKIYTAWMSDSSVAPHPGIQVYTRLNFIDL